MEIENLVVDGTTTDGAHEVTMKENLVQDILNQSFDSEDANQSSLFARLHPQPAPSTVTNNNVSIITDYLILTSASNVSTSIIEALCVTCVISAAPELPNIPLPDDIAYHRVNILDQPSSNLALFFEEMADIIDQVASIGGRTLVFCVAGVSRSASLCIAYLMRYLQMSLLEAYNYVKMRRPRVKPNCGFFKQLIEYEKSIFREESTVRMMFNELVQMEIPDVYDQEYRVVTTRRCRDKYRQ